MKKSKIATTIVEAMVVTLVIVSGLTGVYSIYSSSLKFTITTENKIQAIQIAREGIEALTNIRDTNSILFGSNIDNCWKVIDYNNACIVGSTGFSNISNNGNYRILRDVNNRWILDSAPASAGDLFSNTDYKNFYKIYLDTNGLYTHNSGTELKQFYTRQIKTSYTDPGDGNMGNGLLITSIVRWVDGGGGNVNEIKLESILTNHK